MIRLSMYSGEEIYPDNPMDNFNGMANVYVPSKRHAQSPVEETKNTHDVHTNMKNRYSNTTMPITEKEGASKTNDNKSCAPLTIIAEFPKPFAVSENKQKSRKNKTSINDATLHND